MKVDLAVEDSKVEVALVLVLEVIVALAWVVLASSEV